MAKVIDISSRIIKDMADDFMHFSQNNDAKGLRLLRARVSNMFLRSVPRTADYQAYEDILKHIDRQLLLQPKPKQAKRTLKQF